MFFSLFNAPLASSMDHDPTGSHLTSNIFTNIFTNKQNKLGLLCRPRHFQLLIA